MNRRNFCHVLPGLSLPAQAAVTKQNDREGQTRRRQQIYELHRQAVAPLFDSDGRWTGRSAAPGARERLWNCLAFLTSDSTRDKANAIIAGTFANRANFAFGFSHFEHVASVQLLLRDKGALSAQSRDLLTKLVIEALDRKAEIRFLGYNDNFPAMENAVATLGGQLLDNAAAQQRGMDGMHRLLDLLERRGMLSEYTSSTYSPVTLLCYADIAEYARDPKVRQLALEIERRVWQDIAAHFHPPTNILAGPHSRAYQVDSVGHLHQVHMVLYQVFGDRLWMNPIRFMFPPAPRQVIHHDGDVPFMQASTVWMVTGTYHPTTEIERLIFEKPLPFEVTATSEFGSATGSVMIRNPAPNAQPERTDELFEYPAGDLVATTYMTRDYALGTATSPFLDGNQTDAFFANFRRRQSPNSLGDISTMFSRYVVDDESPGLPWTDARAPGREITRSLLGESGRVHAVHKRNTAIVAYQAKNQFIGDYKRLRLAIIIPVIYREPRRAFQDQEMIWVEDDFFYAAFRPLTITNHSRSEAVHISQANGYLSIDLINYDGPFKKFSRKDLMQTLNGFVVEVGGPGDYGSFAEFQHKVRNASLADIVLSDQRVIEYARSGVRLGLSYSLTYDGLKYATIDGKMQPKIPFRYGAVS